MNIVGFLKKIPTAIMAWFPLIVVAAEIASYFSLSEAGFLGGLLYLILVIAVPIAIPIFLLSRKVEKKPFYQKWWFWLILAILAIVYISATAPESVPIEETKPISSSVHTTESPAINTTEDPDKPTSKATEVPTIETATSAPETEKDIFVNDFCKSSNLSKDAAEAVYNVLTEQLLCENVVFKQKHETGIFSYDISADGFVLVVTTDGDMVYGVSCGTYLMYDNGDVCYTIQDIADRSMSGYESIYYVIATDIIRNCLKSPSTSQFAPMYECAMQRNGIIGAVQGYVDAQNSFGAIIRSNFVVEFVLLDADTWSYEVLYIEVDGEISGEFVPLD